MKQFLSVALVTSSAVLSLRASQGEPIIPGRSADTNMRASRFIDNQGYDAFITAMSENLRISPKGQDPFGNSQDVSVKSAPVVVNANQNQIEKRVTLNEITKRLKVSIVYAGEKKIVIDSKIYKRGESLPVTFGGKEFNLQLTDVTSEQLTFRSQETGEVATLSLKQAAQGLVPSKPGALPPGISLNKKSSRIDLEDDVAAP